ncbi:tRNA (guanine(6)-N2)-methyltransferase THUMP3 isoform X1 [Hydra vulgaris]|uniref:tRNA (guanine(6)-N2)-methyltransferase THUMP3 isoform X1 n=1 Tax=Hydra vulgaris TaxID=6087 RepID=UPI001F5F8587|nr:THUMP domain-containing protein 3 [Hydra vulgaris]
MSKDSIAENLAKCSLDDTVMKFVCSCIPGLEHVAIVECKEKLKVNASLDVRGRITLNLKKAEAWKLTELCSIHHYWVIVEERKNFFTPFQENSNNDALFNVLLNLPGELNWENPLSIWKQFKSILKCTQPEKAKGYQIIDPFSAGDSLSFRVTASRTGKHSFRSMDSAASFGAGLNNYLKWKVDLKDFDIEILLHILDSDLSIGIQLTKDSQSFRNITHFGLTTLSAGFCYCLLHLINIKPGDIICDPMCGGASISIEASCSMPYVFNLAGDNHEIAICHSRENIFNLENLRSVSLPISLVHWDVCRLPLRTSSVDHFVVDLPFGKKVGSKTENFVLYPAALNETARVCVPNGTAVFLTYHKQAMWKTIQNISWWTFSRTHQVNMGGLNVYVFILRRTKCIYHNE